jgi:hypothetical protein
LQKDLWLKLINTVSLQEITMPENWRQKYLRSKKRFEELKKLKKQEKMIDKRIGYSTKSKGEPLVN